LRSWLRGVGVDDCNLTEVRLRGFGNLLSSRLQSLLRADVVDDRNLTEVRLRGFGNLHFKQVAVVALRGRRRRPQPD
jgi:hypothetical protein